MPEEEMDGEEMCQWSNGSGKKWVGKEMGRRKNVEVETTPNRN
jgi:hypothetical protein